ncbi:GrpB family protein [Synechococcus sp. CS-602]|uniref:GrpB family protein n=1 Tax=Synechococcaceae TaxID=1890426 RepID=UPI0008FF12C2|nr:MULTISPECIES: GrpB family protein [Synechococcaceae]MCT4364900.1 GrpB family protein [Candidatus Regnicoccus frigidus MAG-AL1]MCT0203401.1 GrpB family protein [Synechococcus sp. CS-603]MCT0204049.1 GrpB family protein [Synechococcus sp. CS-602]MCT0246621.1 GrpB family protein [Synechococcus sp. CS-601]MCT4368402.1 GrpB family protein [Candidatus Regnicoccus frigidus MAG-AL2]
MLDAEIEIVPYNSGWTTAFLEERKLLRAVLEPWLIGEIEHVGSTAVAGMSAKPTIDIMAPVESLGRSRAATAVAVEAGYVHYPYKLEQMLWFCKPSPERRTHHLYLVPYNSLLWLERLAFRDILRQDKILSSAYANLKVELASRFRSDREAYSQAKAPFIQAVLASRCSIGPA